MAIGASSSTHILTRAGFEKLEFALERPQQKIRLYHIRALTAEKIESARAAILEELDVKNRAFEGGIDTFEQRIQEKPYLIKEGKSLRLISYEAMTQYFNQALASANGQETEASTCCKIGNTFQSIGHYKEALEYHDKCLGFAIREQDKRAEGSVYYNIANACHSLEEYPQALSHYQKCLAIAEKWGSQETMKRAYYSIGDVCQSLEMDQEALEYFMKYLEIAKKLSDQEELGAVYCRLGNTYKSLGAYQQAKDSYEQALKMGRMSAQIELNRFQ